MKFKTLQTMLDYLDSIPISMSNLLKMSSADNYIFYSDLANYDSFEDLFSQKGDKIIVFFRISGQSGHYTCLFRQSNHSCIYFDPYGFPIEKLLGYATKEAELSQGADLFSKLESNSKMTLTRNDYKFQSDGSLNNSIDTCGYHTASRLMFSDYDNDEYKTFILSAKINPDDLVLMLSLNDVIQYKISLDN